MKVFSGVALLVLLVACQTELMLASCISDCVGMRTMLSCPGRTLMSTAFLSVTRANCRNCAEYFHCTGNYNAVYRCRGSRLNNRRIAKLVSDCHERCLSGGGDNGQKQEASAFGRNGGDCSRYLCAYGCTYSPVSVSCDMKYCL